VAGGDTLRVARVSVRLRGVAAPELAHPGFGIAEEPGYAPLGAQLDLGRGV
jgi:endonuclease YncB( thermonuclease family)